MAKKDEELIAIAKIQKILGGLPAKAQRRILDYLDDRWQGEVMPTLEETE